MQRRAPAPERQPLVELGLLAAALLHGQSGNGRVPAAATPPQSEMDAITADIRVQLAEQRRLAKQRATVHRPIATMQLVCAALLASFVLCLLKMDTVHAWLCVHAVCLWPLVSAVRGWQSAATASASANVLPSIVAVAVAAVLHSALPAEVADAPAAIAAHLCAVLAAQTAVARRTRMMVVAKDGDAAPVPGSAKTLPTAAACSSSSARTMRSASVQAFYLRTAAEPTVWSELDLDTAASRCAIDASDDGASTCAQCGPHGTVDDCAPAAVTTSGH